MERRKQTRTPRRLYLTIDNLPGHNIAFTGDVSPQGILIETNAALSPGRVVTIQLTLPTGRHLRLHGQVRWATRNSTLSKGHFNQYGIGVSLEEVPEEFRRFIESIAEPEAPAAAAAASSGTPSAPAQIIAAAHKAMKRQTHYQVLGVARDATHDQIRQAYYTLSRTYHPQQPLAETSPELRSQMESLFDRIAEAYVVLGSERRRERYDRALG